MPPVCHENYIFSFDDTTTTEIYTLSLHDALPICHCNIRWLDARLRAVSHRVLHERLHGERWQDRKSTRLNSSHVAISYAVFCLKKKIMIPASFQIRDLTIRSAAVLDPMAGGTEQL